MENDIDLGTSVDKEIEILMAIYICYWVNYVNDTTKLCQKCYG